MSRRVSPTLDDSLRSRVTCVTPVTGASGRLDLGRPSTGWTSRSGGTRPAAGQDVEGAAARRRRRSARAAGRAAPSPRSRGSAARAPQQVSQSILVVMRERSQGPPTVGTAGVSAPGVSPPGQRAQQVEQRAGGRHPGAAAGGVVGDLAVVGHHHHRPAGRARRRPGRGSRRRRSRPRGLKSTRTPRGAFTGGRWSVSAASKTTVVSAPVRATSGASAVTSRIRCASSDGGSARRTC